jgi:uncharacterized protein (TIGR02231 family)
MEIVNSKITAVTVFMDRALITRTAQVPLEAGEHILVFDNLPESIDSKSVQASGIGSASLMGVKFKKDFFLVNTDEATREIEAQQTQLKDQIGELSLEEERWKGEQKFLEAIVQKTTSTKEGTEKTELNPENWIKMLDFYSQKQAEIHQNLLKLAYQIRELKHKNYFLQKKLQDITEPHRQNQESRTVEVVVEAKQAGELVVELSYIVRYASWVPVYDLRVSTETKKVNLTYNAMVRQNTGEAWEDVKIKISTAKPQLSGKHEELTPWFIDFMPTYQPKGMMGGDRVNRSISVQKEEISMQNEMLWHKQAEAKLADEKIVDILDKLDTKNAVAETGATAVFFNIAGKHTIKADNTDHRVSILVEDFEGHFRYSTAPKKTPLAYLKVKIRNTSPYPLLAGESNIFLDNNFVSNAPIGNVPPNESFWAFLGVDESMKVDYKLMRKYEKQEGGLISKKMISIMFEYQIKVKNTKNTEEEIVIWEQLPISQNAQIKVHLIEPVYKEATENFSKQDHDALRWFFKLKSQESIVLNFKFSVDYPFGQSLMNL